MTLPITDILVPLGDLHLGYKNCNVSMFKEVVQFIDNNDALWIGMGDYIDNTSPRNKFYDPSTSVMTIQEQIFSFCDLVEPIKNKCVGLLMGNHELRGKHDGINAIAQIERMLNIDKKYRTLGTQTYFRLKNTNKTIYTFFAMHGHGTCTVSTSIINKLHKMHDMAEADFYLMGHHHSIYTKSSQYITGKRTLKKRYYVGTGAYLGYFDGYPEEARYFPLELGCNAVYLNPVSIRRVV